MKCHAASKVGCKPPGGPGETDYLQSLAFIEQGQCIEKGVEVLPWLVGHDGDKVSTIGTGTRHGGQFAVRRRIKHRSFAPGLLGKESMESRPRRLGHK